MKKGTLYSIFMLFCGIIYSYTLTFPHGEKHGWIIRMIKKARAKAKEQARAKKIAKKQNIKKFKNYHLEDVTSDSSEDYPKKIQTKPTKKALFKKQKTHSTKVAHKKETDSDTDVISA